MGNSSITEFPFANVQRIQEERIQTQDYKALGRVVWISMELQLDHPPTLREKFFQGRFDFQNQGPLLAMSKDFADLLLPDGVPLQLPDIPDPTWVPPAFKQPTVEQLADPKWKPTPSTPPLERQSWIDRPCKTFGAGKEIWVAFQPIVQVWFRPFGVPTYSHVTCKPTAWGGKGTVLLVQPETGKAHFYGGVFEIGSR
jgi:hypothetical protein